MTTDTDDKRITDTYRDLASERTPADLDDVSDLRRWQREAFGDDAILRAAATG